LLTTLVSGWSLEPFPPARIMPFIRAFYAIGSSNTSVGSYSVSANTPQTLPVSLKTILIQWRTGIKIDSPARSSITVEAIAGGQISIVMNPERQQTNWFAQYE
jgi:hypothetical protein